MIESKIKELMEKHRALKPAFLDDEELLKSILPYGEALHRKFSELEDVVSDGGQRIDVKAEIQRLEEQVRRLEEKVRGQRTGREDVLIVEQQDGAGPDKIVGSRQRQNPYESTFRFVKFKNLVLIGFLKNNYLSGSVPAQQVDFRNIEAFEDAFMIPGQAEKTLRIIRQLKIADAQNNYRYGREKYPIISIQIALFELKEVEIAPGVTAQKMRSLIAEKLNTTVSQSFTYKKVEDYSNAKDGDSRLNEINRDFQGLW